MARGRARLTSGRTPSRTVVENVWDHRSQCNPLLDLKDRGKLSRGVHWRTGRSRRVVRPRVDPGAPGREFCRSSLLSRLWNSLPHESATPADCSQSWRGPQSRPASAGSMSKWFGSMGRKSPPQRPPSAFQMVPSADHTVSGVSDAGAFPTRKSAAKAGHGRCLLACAAG